MGSFGITSHYNTYNKKMMKFILVLSFLFLGIANVNAIDCYECINCDDADDATQKSCSSSLFDSCIKFTASANGVESTLRGCYKDIGNVFSDGECKEGPYLGVTGTICVCDSNLCNGVERMLPHFAMFLMTILLAYYVM